MEYVMLRMTEDSYHRTNIKILKVYPSFILGKCQCGHCNEDIPIRSKQKILYRYKKGHYNFKGVKKCGLYQIIYRPNHPNAMKDGYVLNHRLIYEHYLKILFDEDIYIPSDIEIHHIIPIDEGGTDALINLIPVTHKEHARYHTTDMSDRTCSICGSDKTYISTQGLHRWYGNKEIGFICASCHRKDPIVKEMETQRRHERMKDPVYNQKRREYGIEYRKRKRLEINTLDKYRESDEDNITE